jgi:hypothetical protein
MAFLQPVQVDQLPQSIEAFVALHASVAQTPQGGAAMMVIALLAYACDEVLGRQCLTAAVDRERLEEGPDGYDGWQLRTSDMRRVEAQIGRQSYLPKSYVKGATPENGYRLPVPPYVFECSDNPYSGDPETGTYKIFVSCSGAASPRPVTLNRNSRGLWKAHEWSSLIVGVSEPAQEADDNL